MFTSNVIIGFITLSGIAAVAVMAAEHLKCYQCNSLKDAECESGDASELEKFAKPCSTLKDGTYKGSEAIACRKTVQNIDSVQRIVRECAYSGDPHMDGMRKQGNKGVKILFYQCENGDKDTPCNGASSLFQSALLYFTLIPLIGFLLLNHY